MLATAAWLLTSIQVEASAGGMHFGNQVAIPWWIDETYAVLDGLTPLANFTSPYGHLWPYFAASAMALLGASIGVFTVAMATGSGAALIAIFAVFRRILRSSAAALAVYLPFLATGFFVELGPLANRYAPSTLLSMFPMRYAGPYLLAWLTARHVDGAAPRRLTALFLAAGFVAINGLEFGVPALGATLAAILWTRPWSWATIGRVLRAAALGVGGAAALYALFTLIRAGSLPDYGALTFYPKLYGVVGYDLLPMPAVGFHLVLYATFAAAIVVATVRAVDRHPDVLLTGMLAWSGVFGLGAGGYFAGRSHPEVLIDLFSAWALALVLLLVVVVRAMLARASRWPRPAELAVLLGFGIAVCSLAQVPTPWSQLRRLRHDAPPWQYGPAAAERFVARFTKPGEHVAILMIPSHQIAYDVGVRNVAPYIGWDWMPFKEQVEQTFDALDRSGGRKAFANGGVERNSGATRPAARRLERRLRRVRPPRARHGRTLRRRRQPPAGLGPRAARSGRESSSAAAAGSIVAGSTPRSASARSSAPMRLARPLIASAIGSGRWTQSASGPSGRRPSTRTGWPGLPTTVEFGGTSWITTVLAPIFEPWPIGDRAEQLRARADRDVVLHGRVALAGGEAGAAERDALVERDVVADLRRLADHDAHPVVDEEALADLRRRVDLDPGERARDRRDQPRQQRHARRRTARARRGGRAGVHARPDGEDLAPSRRRGRPGRAPGRRARRGGSPARRGPACRGRACAQG